MILLVFPFSYDDKRAYGQSKLANILHANELARRLQVNMSAKIILQSSNKFNFFVYFSNFKIYYANFILQKTCVRKHPFHVFIFLNQYPAKN